MNVTSNFFLETKIGIEVILLKKRNHTTLVKILNPI